MATVGGVLQVWFFGPMDEREAWNPAIFKVSCPIQMTNKSFLCSSLLKSLPPSLSV